MFIFHTVTITKNRILFKQCHILQDLMFSKQQHKAVVFWAVTPCVLVAASIFRAEDSKAGSSALMVTSYQNMLHHTPEGSNP